MTDDTLNLEAYEDVTSAELKIKNPTTGAPTPMVITLAGPEHAERKRLTFAKQRRMRAALSKTGKIPVSDPEDDADEETDLLVVCTLGWIGASTPYSREAARKLYTDPKRQWLRDQVSAALNERELFTQACAPA